MSTVEHPLTIKLVLNGLEVEAANDITSTTSAVAASLINTSLMLPGNQTTPIKESAKTKEASIKRGVLRHHGCTGHQPGTSRT